MKKCDNCSRGRMRREVPMCNTERSEHRQTYIKNGRPVDAATVKTSGIIMKNPTS